MRFKNNNNKGGIVKNKKLPWGLTIQHTKVYVESERGGSCVGQFRFISNLLLNTKAGYITLGNSCIFVLPRVERNIILTPPVIYSNQHLIYFNVYSTTYIHVDFEYGIANDYFQMNNDNSRKLWINHTVTLSALNSTLIPYCV